MSIIASPPIDRLAVRTFVMPYDPVTIREAIMRERDRGGQIFYVVPRIADLDEVREQLRETVPEIKYAVAHGRMAPTELEAAMTAFDERAYDLLLSTNIIESGLDIPSANTLIMHRSDMFGLAQLYQLRGRIGRSKIRAYAYLTLPERRKLAPTAQRRLEVMQTLDTLGAGFQLASHDLDIRGAGNLLGDEQSGHIREVGIEKLEAGPKGAVIALRENRFANPAGLVDLIQRNAGTLKLRPDHKIVYLRNWEDAKTRLAGVAKLAQALAKIARTAQPETDAQLPQPTPELVKQRSAGRRESAAQGPLCRRRAAASRGCPIWLRAAG